VNIVLIGYRCSGKSAVGKILARELGRDLVDTDVLIEQYARSSIENIVSRDGWTRFREIEKRVIEEISKKDKLVIAAGGGVVLDEANVRNLTVNEWLVWLDGSAEALKERMDREQRAGKIRPSLTGADPLEEIEQVVEERAPLYRQAGDLTADTSALTAGEVAVLIMKTLPKEMKG